MLPYIWFGLIAVLIIGYIVMDGFDLGAGILYPFIAKTEEEKRSVIRSIGPVWDGNEVWLLTAGGALFAAFPAVYATVFSGFYLALMLVLFCLIMRAAALEFRNYDPKWKKLWDGTFFVASALPALLVGVAAGNVMRGVPLDKAGEFAGNFFTLLNPFALLVGVAGFCWITWHGASWLSKKLTGELQLRAAKARRNFSLATIIVFVITTVLSPMLIPATFNMGINSWISWVGVAIVLVGVIVAILGGSKALRTSEAALAHGGVGLTVKDKAGADFCALIGSGLTGAGAVLIWAGTIFPYMLPARLSDGSISHNLSLSVVGTASSTLTLTAMLIITCIGVPLVLFYNVLIYKTYAGRIKVEPGEDGHGAY